MSGGGGSAPASQTVTQTNLPEYVRPQFERLLSRAESQSITPYQPFQGQRIAQPGTDINMAYDMTRNVATSGVPGLPQAAGVVAGNIGAGQQIAQGISPYQFSGAGFQQQEVSPFAGFQQQEVSPFAGFQQQEVSPFAGFQQQEVSPFAGFQQQDVDQYGFDPTQTFTGESVGQYMSPYMQRVLDVQKDQARRQFAEQGAGRAAQAVQAGAFGGSRQAVQEAIAERDLLDRMADIQATGQQRAFESAQQAFQSDRGAQFAREQAQAQELARAQGIGVDEAARVQAAQAQELARTQGISVGEAARTQAAQAQELARTQGIGVDEAARVQGARAAELGRVQSAQAAEDQAARAQQLQALGFTSDQAQQMVGMGETARAADIQGSQLLETVGRAEMGQEQQGLDIAYQDYLRQQAYPEQQLQFLSSILRGVPVEPGATTTGYAPYNPLQQALGAGLTGLSLYRGLSG